MPSERKRRGNGAWDFRRKEGDSGEDGKEQMFGSQMFAGPHRNSETQRGILRNRLYEVPFPRYPPTSPPTVYTPSSYYTIVIYGIYEDSSLPGTDPLSTFF